MNRSWSILFVLIVILAAGARAQDVTPLGGEFVVNTYTVGNQRVPSVGVDAQGDFVVTWMSSDQDGSSYGTFARRYDSAGTALGAAFQVNASTAGSQGLAEIAMESNGDFVVAWAGPDGGLYGIFARRFDSAGVALSGDLQLNTYTTNTQNRPSIAMDADGDFVVAWMSSGQDGVGGYGVFARRVSSAGALLGAELLVNARTPLSQFYPRVASDSVGNFVVTWLSNAQDGDGTGVFARTFSSSGVPGSELQVNTYTTGSQGVPRVGRDAAGDFVIAWSSPLGASANDVRARRFDPFGVAQGGEMQVNSFTVGDQFAPAVGLRDDGRFVIAWQSFDQDGEGFGIFGRGFSADGRPLASEFQVNEYSANDQGYASIDINGAGDFVVAWHSDGVDGSFNGISARRFTIPAVLDIDGNGEIAALSDGVLILRFMFGFNGATLTSGAIGEECTRCDAAAIEPYLMGLS